MHLWKSEHTNQNWAPFAARTAGYLLAASHAYKHDASWAQYRVVWDCTEVGMAQPAKLSRMALQMQMQGPVCMQALAGHTYQL